MKQITLRFKDEEHQFLRKYLFDKNQSFQQYIMNLIKKDIEKNKEKKA